VYKSRECALLRYLAAYTVRRLRRWQTACPLAYDLPGSAVRFERNLPLARIITRRAKARPRPDCNGSWPWRFPDGAPCLLAVSTPTWTLRSKVPVIAFFGGRHFLRRAPLPCFGRGGCIDNDRIYPCARVQDGRFIRVGCLRIDVSFCYRTGSTRPLDRPAHTDAALSPMASAGEPLRLDFRVMRLNRRKQTRPKYRRIHLR